MAKDKKEGGRHVVPDRTHTDRATNQPTPGGATGGAGKPPLRRSSETEEDTDQGNDRRTPPDRTGAGAGGHGAASKLQPGSTRPRRGD